jgi:hypothetical protein
MLEFLRNGYLLMRIPELTTAFNASFALNKSAAQIKSTLKNHKFTCGRPPGYAKGERSMLNREQVQFLRQNYLSLNRVELTNALNSAFATEYTSSQIVCFLKNHGIRSGRTGAFRKGSTPPNKGVKGWQAGGRSAETRFQRGRPAQEAHNYLRIGSTKLDKDGYLVRKVTDDPLLVPARRWVGEHRLIWEAANGPIPAGHVVVFLDADKGNIVLENLRCVHKSVIQYMNKTGLNGTSGEARKAAILTSEIMATVFKKSRP